MFPLRLPYRRIIATVLLSVALALTTKEAQTVTVSDAHLRNEKENWQREVSAQVKPEQGSRSETLLTAQRQQRIALVIGNRDYQEDPLSNPVNDATDVAKALKDLGFEVTLLKNLNWQAMDEAIENFSKQLHQGAVGVFYYAGHGVQVKGENYLIPIDARLKRERDVRREAVSLFDVLAFMEKAENQLNIIIIDACRDNPFYRRWRRTRGSTSVRGLSDKGLSEPPQGTIIAFATGPGEFAEDGEGKRNSPFTSNLLMYIKNPDLEIVDLFRKVRNNVWQETNQLQRPWYRESLVGSFFFNPKQTQPTDPSLFSETTGVNYNQLGKLLDARKWKDADEETTRVILKAAGRVKEGVLLKGDIDKFPCEDLRIIDQLWLNSSDKQFGFSVQKKIYQSLDGTREFNREVVIKFGDRVGWRKENNWLYYNNLTFNLNAPEGQLPAGGLAWWLYGWERWEWRKDLLSHKCL